MMSPEQNEEITLTGTGQPAGKLLRRYWQPVALLDELEQQRPVVPLKVMGEDLVLFRDQSGGLGLVGRYCPHRGADLCYGRLEHGGLRCVFHGWLFDKTGQCMEQPAEPEDSQMYKRIKTSGYPVVQKNGIVFAYMGSGKPPGFPGFDCFSAPNEYTFAFKGLIESNWLQALEVGIDPAHASFLHRYLEDEDTAKAYGKQFRDRVGDSDIPMTQLLREYPRPEIIVERTDYGLRIITLRHLENGKTHVRITNQVFPTAITIPMSNEMTITQWHVPIDDHNCYWYAIFTSFGKEVDKTLMRDQRLALYQLPDYVPNKNKRNNYGYDPNEQDTRTYTGMGLDINVHDQWAVESMGSIQDRSKEHLAKSDKAIVQYRKILRTAIAQVTEGSDRDLPLTGQQQTLSAVKGPIAIDTIAAKEEWQTAWRDSDAQRRAACAWDASLGDE
ncbi:MAG: aromatic ring-hydroxylating dioxygenase subunit alpha [Arenicellales bacterium]|nr:aromatic ring-hydroxylating dioxygenase subunit alpha [Arenicellales bacterium]